MTPRRAIGCVIIASAILLAGCGRAVGADLTTRSVGGAIIEPGELGTRHLRAGDCIRDPIPAEVGALYGVPCGRAHAAQVFAVVTDSAICVDLAARDLAALVSRTDLPTIDVSALLIDGDDDHVVCVLEFAEPIAEDLIRPAA